MRNRKSRDFKKSPKSRLFSKKHAFLGKLAGQRKKSPKQPIRGLQKEKTGFFDVIWQMSLLEVEKKGLRRPPTPLEAFKHHLASQPRIFVEQVFKILHRYVHFIPLFFYLFHGLFQRFLAFFLAYFFVYFLHISLLFVFIILPLISMPFTLGLFFIFWAWKSMVK